MKALRNRTIDFSIEEGKKYLNNCISVRGKVLLKDIINEKLGWVVEKS